MKKFTAPIFKSISFLIVWLTLISIISAVPFGNTAPSFFGNNDAMQRLWWELIPCVVTLLVSVFFTRVVEKGKITVPVFIKPTKNIVTGFVWGVIWIGVPTLVLYWGGIMHFDAVHNIPYLAVWFFAALLNVMMQEYLMRGYLFQMLKQKVNVATAMIVTTLLFTIMHGGVFEAGIVAVLNVITMSVFVTLLLLYCESLLSPIIVHFIWNSIGCMILGGVSLAEDYPSLLVCHFYGKTVLTGGTVKMEGSIVVLTVNLLFITVLWFLLRRKTKKQS